jgi:hypothetical protein
VISHEVDSPLLMFRLEQSSDDTRRKQPLLPSAFSLILLLYANKRTVHRALRYPEELIDNIESVLRENAYLRHRVQVCIRNNVLTNNSWLSVRCGIDIVLLV